MELSKKENIRTKSMNRSRTPRKASVHAKSIHENRIIMI